MRKLSTPGAPPRGAMACVLIVLLMLGGLATLFGKLETSWPALEQLAGGVNESAAYLPDGPLVDAANDTERDLQDGSVMAQMALLAYASDPFDFKYTGVYPGGTGDRMYLNVREQCVAFETIACYDALHFTLDAPNFVKMLYPMSNLTGPFFCVRRAEGFGLVVAFRGSFSIDDAVTDAAGGLYHHQLPVHGNFTDNLYDNSMAEMMTDAYLAQAGLGHLTATGAEGHASMHGSFMDCFSAGRALLHAHLQDPQYADEPLYITGHSLGGALAMIATHDVVSEMRRGALPPREVRLHTQGKPMVGSEPFAQSIQTLLDEGTHLKVVRRHVLAFGTAYADPVTDVPVQTAMGWKHESPGLALQCGGTPDLPTGHSVRCHSSVKYAVELELLAHEPEGLHASCAARLPAPFSSINVCGPTLEDYSIYQAMRVDSSLEQCVNDGRPYRAVMKRDASTELVEVHRFWLLFWTITLLWLTVHVIAVIVSQRVMGSAEPWRGPFFVGLLSWGDGSFAYDPFERTMKWLGLKVDFPSEFYVDTMAMGAGVPPARVPALLAAQGFRGRSDDASGRFPSSLHAKATQIVPLSGTAIAKEKELEGLEEKKDQEGKPKGWQVARNKRKEIIKTGAGQTRTDAAASLPLTRVSSTLIAPGWELARDKRKELIKGLGSQGGLNAGMCEDMKDEKISEEGRRSLSVIRMLLDEQNHKRKLAASLAKTNQSTGGATAGESAEDFLELMADARRRYALLTRMGGLLRKALDEHRRRPPAKSSGSITERLALTVAFQASDHNRENFVSPLVACCILTMGIAQVIAIQGLDPLADGRFFLFQRHILPPYRPPPDVPDMCRIFSNYITFGLACCVMTVGNVKALTDSYKDEVALAVSTVANLAYFFWVGRNHLQQAGWYDAREHSEILGVGMYEVPLSPEDMNKEWVKQITKGPMLPALLNILLWATLIPQALVCLRFLTMCVGKLLPLCLPRRAGGDSSAGCGAWYRRQWKTCGTIVQRLLGVGDSQATKRIPVVIAAAMCTSLTASISLTVLLYINTTPWINDVSDYVQVSLEWAYDNLERFRDNAPTSIGFLQFFADYQSQACDWIVTALLVGVTVGTVLVALGCIHTWQTYAMAYDVFWTHGPAVLRFPIQRANSKRFFATFVAYQLLGVVLCMLWCVGLAMFIFLVVVDWPWVTTLRNTVLNAYNLLMIELLFVRPILTPTVQRLNCGPASFMIEIWYLGLSPLAGISRLFFLFIISFGSFFKPAQCIFPDGSECWDNAHVTFVSYVMARVEHDKKLAQATDALFRAALQSKVQSKVTSIKVDPGGGGGGGGEGKSVAAALGLFSSTATSEAGSSNGSSRNTSQNTSVHGGGGELQPQLAMVVEDLTPRE